MARFESLTAWLNWQEQLHPRPIDLGLERVAKVYHQLNQGRGKIPTITVAGTNGKGSCIAYLEAIYLAQGYRVGAFTSPHILRYNERIRINGQPVDDQTICRSFERIDALRGETSLSYFEFGTLAGLDIFAEADLDIQLLEVGLGGRLDAVNIIDADVALVTTIGLDHVEWLGNTLEAIAKEKAGIFRTGKAAIVGDEVTQQGLVQIAEQKQANLLQLGKAYRYTKQANDWDWYNGSSHLSHLPSPVLKGEHQFRNAAAVLMAVSELQAVLPVASQSIAQGLKAAELKGRFQLITGQPSVLLDVGHNPQAVQTLIEHLQEHFSTVKIHAVFAMMKDKDIATVIAMMKPYIDSWHLAPLANPRAASQELLADYFQQQDISKVYSGYSDCAAAFKVAQDRAQSDDLILVFGSFFLVSEYLANFT
jgi:dihydrofolate synthase/folylpolyglutamate synthase